MADILIFGMKMPENEPLRLVLNPNGQLFVDHGVTFTEYEAIELPEHWDLISLKDAKTVIDRFLGYLDEEMIYRIKYKLNQDCPVIIPASKEETE